MSGRGEWVVAEEPDRGWRCDCEVGVGVRPDMEAICVECGLLAPLLPVGEVLEQIRELGVLLRPGATVNPSTSTGLRRWGLRGDRPVTPSRRGLALMRRLELLVDRPAVEVLAGPDRELLIALTGSFLQADRERRSQVELAAGDATNRLLLAAQQLVREVEAGDVDRVRATVAAITDECERLFLLGREAG